MHAIEDDEYGEEQMEGNTTMDLLGGDEGRDYIEDKMMQEVLWLQQTHFGISWR